MTTGNFSESQGPLLDNSGQPSRISLLTMFRLGLFQMGLGMMSVLIQGVLNRVMINELAIPAVVAIGAISVNQLMAPARVWFGQLSDSKPLGGYHRSAYVWGGAACFVVILFLAVQVSWQLGSQMSQITEGWTSGSYLFTGLLGLVFAFYGLALSASSTPFAALLVDVSDEKNRSKLVGVVWSMLMVGIIIGAIVSSVLTKRLDLNASIDEVQQTINRLFIIVPGVVLGLALLSTWGIEKKYSLFGSRSSLVEREDQITLKTALGVLTASRQTGLFFTFLLVMTISLFLQDGVMEPYGGTIFQMTISQTTQLNAFWGTGTLFGLSLTGFLIVPRLGKQRTTRLGCWMCAGCLLLILLAGFTQNPKVLQSALLIFGLASGMATTGAISLMLDLTAAETAGTFIGAWGLAQAFARFVAFFGGGALLSLGKSLLGQPMLAFGLVFGLQAIGMLVAVTLLNRVNVQEFRTDAKRAISQVMQGDLD